MNIITAKVGTPVQLHLDSDTLITALTAASFTVTGFIGSTTVSNAVSELSFGVSELTSSHYLATVTYTEEGTHYLKIVYSTFSVEFMIQVVKDTVSYFSGRMDGADAEYVFTVTDASANAVEGATVRIFDSAGTKQLMKLTTKLCLKISN